MGYKRIPKFHKKQHKKELKKKELQQYSSFFLIAASAEMIKFMLY